MCLLQIKLCLIIKWNLHEIRFNDIIFRDFIFIIAMLFYKLSIKLK